MNRRLFGAFGVLTIVVLPVESCKSDPLSEVDGNPAAVVTDFSYLQMPVSSTNTITASVLDARTNALAVPITFTACTSDITVVPDPDYNPVPNTSARAIVTANTPNPSCVRVAGGGLEDTVQVAVLPQTFTGTASTTNPVVGQPFKLYGNTMLGFDVDSANIDFGGGVVGWVISRVLDTLTVAVPQLDDTTAGPITVLGVAVKYAPGAVVDLPMPGPFQISSIGDRETPGEVLITIPASGAPDTTFYDGFRSGADGTTVIDYLYQFTLAVTDTLTFTLSWPGGADLDMVNLRANFSLIGGIGAATAANPETYSVIFPAGTYYLLIESFDDHDDPAHIFQVTIHNP